MTTTENKDEVVSVELPAPAAWKKLVFFGFFLKMCLFLDLPLFL